MTKNFLISLERHDLGQLLDGLRARADAWSKTADYLESGHSSDDLFLCEDCSNHEEARRIAQHYENLIADIERQKVEQEGRP